MDAALAIPALDTPEAASALLAREEGGVRRILGYYVHDHAAVDDLWQEVSLRVLRRLHTLQHPAAARGWIYQIARNAAMDWLRRCDRAVVRPTGEVPEISAGGDDGRSPGDQLLSSERIAAVRKALAELPPSQREAIRLRVEEGLDHVQIAQRLGINRQAVEVRLCKGRAALRERLADIFEGDL
ncbi:MAG: sigma-70 family RNA polymerase sigma factor [Planctomycetes bacterium]|nr:sigma-70 family RNA polymerase sigma factor [Planctomycetota bacterium]